MSLTREQLELRKSKVMASNVAGLLGLSPYTSRVAAWAECIGLVQTEENEAMRSGNFLERGLLDWASAKLKVDRVESPGTIFHPVKSWAGCTPDGLWPSACDGIQIKVHNLGILAQFSTHHPEEVSEPHNDLIPEHHLIQCTWEMYVTGARVWWLGAYFGGADFRLYRLHRDEDLVRMLVEQAEQVWRDYIVPQKEPPMDGDEATTAYLKKRYPRAAPGKVLQPTPDILAWATRYQELGTRIKELETARDEAKNNIVAVMQDAEAIENVCTYKLTKPKPKPDYESIARLHPDFADLSALHIITPEPQRRFLVNLKSNE